MLTATVLRRLLRIKAVATSIEIVPKCNGAVRALNVLPKASSSLVASAIASPCVPPTAYSIHPSCRQFHESAVTAARLARRSRPGVAAEHAPASSDTTPDAGSVRTSDQVSSGEDSTASASGRPHGPGIPQARHASRVTAFDSDPIIESYMKLRASGKHVDAAEEEQLAVYLLERAATLSDPAELGDLQEDSDSGSEDEGEELSEAELQQYRTQLTESLTTIPTQPASLANRLGEPAGDQGQHASAQEREQLSASEGQPENTGRVGDPSPAGPSGSNADAKPGAAVAAWRPQQRQLTPEELKRDLILRSLAHEVNERLDTRARSQVLTDGVPAFLLEDDGQDLGLRGTPAAGLSAADVGTRLLRLGVVGIPNAGKSALTNYLVGGKISAVSSRPETTRLATLGAFTEGTTQVVLYDTPGMHGTRDFRSRSHAMRVAATWTNVADCDALAFIVDGEKQLGKFATRHVPEIAEALGSQAGPGVPNWQRLPVVLLMNKVDLVSKQRLRLLMQYAEELGRMCEFERVFFISAKEGHGVADLRRYLVSMAKPGEWDLPPNAPTDQDWPELAAELVREKLYWNHKNEIPYKLVPVTVDFKQHADGRVQIEQEVAVRTQRIKQMVIGPNHERLLRIERTVGAELAHMLKRRVEVSVRVKIRKDAALPLDLI